MKPRLAFATCAQVPDLSDDDRLAVRELKTLGIDVVAAVWDAPGDWSRFDAVVIRSTWDYWLKYSKFREWLDAIEKASVRVWNPARIVRENSDKRYLLALERAGFPIVPTVWLEPRDGRSLPEVMEQNGWAEVIVKPVVSGNAFLTHRLTREQARSARPLLQDCWKLGPAMIQPFLPSVVAEGEYSLLFFANEFSHAVLKRSAPHDFRVQHHYGGTTSPARIDPEWIRLAERIVRGAGEKLLYARVDMAAHEGRPRLMELELAEPFLYFGDSPGSAARFARALRDFLRG